MATFSCTKAEIAQSFGGMSEIYQSSFINRAKVRFLFGSHREYGIAVS